MWTVRGSICAATSMNRTSLRPPASGSVRVSLTSPRLSLWIVTATSERSRSLLTIGDGVAAPPALDAPALDRPAARRGIAASARFIFIAATLYHPLHGEASAQRPARRPHRDADGRSLATRESG